MELVYHNRVARYIVSEGMYRFELKETFKNTANILFPLFLKFFDNQPISTLINFDVLESEFMKYVKRERVVYRYLKKFLDGYNHDNMKDMVIFLVFKMFDIEVLFPIIADVLVNELFVDGHGRRIYIDHALLGRRDTEILLNSRQISNLLLFIKVYGDTLIAGINPSAKIDLRFHNQRLRISVDSDRRGRVSIAIRKLSSIPPFFSLIRDVNNRKILSLIATLMVFRPNIVIFGETGAGKTTLAGILLSILPDSWRIITIEDVLEIPDKLIENKRIVRILVPTFETRLVAPLSRNKFMVLKETEIIKLLHRSPDFCFISEIQDASDTRAIFHAFAAGIRGIATTHARDIYGLLNRWMGIYNIPSEWVHLIDILIFMVRELHGGGIRRSIGSVYIPINASSGSALVRDDLFLTYTIKNRRIEFINIPLSNAFSLEYIKKILSVFFLKRLNRPCNRKIGTLVELFNNIYNALGKMLKLIGGQGFSIDDSLQERAFTIFRDIAKKIEKTINETLMC